MKPARGVLLCLIAWTILVEACAVRTVGPIRFDYAPGDLENALHSGRPTMLEVSSPTCAACVALAPQVEALRQGYGDRVNVLVANLGEASDLVQTYRVVGIPTFLFFNSAGQKVRTLVASTDRTALEAAMESLVRSSSGGPAAVASSDGTAAMRAPVTSVAPASRQGEAPAEMEIKSVHQKDSKITMEVAFWLDHAVVPGTVSVLLDGQPAHVVATDPDISSEVVSEPVFVSGGRPLAIVVEEDRLPSGATLEVQLTIEEKGC